MTSPAKQNRERSPRSELILAKIYEEAARLFAERGYAGTTPQDIAEAVGVSRQSLYYYVSSKEEILQQLVAELTTQTVERMQVVVSEQSGPVEKLRALAYHLVIDRATNRTRFRMLDRSSAALPPNLAEDFLSGRRALLRLVTQVIDEGISAGSFKSDDSRVAALCVLGTCNWVAWWFDPGTEHPVEPVARQIADNCVAMLQTRAGATADPQLIAAARSVRAALGQLDDALS